MNEIMIDLETLGTRADSVILSIGAVRFSLEGELDDAGFYSSISIDSNHEAAPRHISESTINFWMQQSNEARVVFTEPKTTLYSALVDLIDWIQPAQNDVRVWGNGSDFDISMMAHAFSTNDLDIPWNFWNIGCFRTLKNLPKARAVPKPEAPLVAHHALHDALSQVKHLQAIWQVIK